MNYKAKFAVTFWSMTMPLLVMSISSPVLAQTGETTSKDTPIQGRCLTENGRPGADNVTSCPPAGSTISSATSTPSRVGLSLAPIVGPNTSVEEARRKFEDGARRGYAPAEVNLGVLYACGWGVHQNMGTALYWMKLAADQGNVQALANLGILYRNGWGVPLDQARAFRLFQTAAEGGDAGAMTNLGYAYDKGLGIARSQQVAIEWYRKAAELGNATAQSDLADIYLRGEGVSQDDKKAFELFSKSAAQGNTAARIKVGFLYMTGRGTGKNAEAAYTWIKAAALAGDSRGAEYLRVLTSELSSTQRKQADERAYSLQAQSVSGIQFAAARP